MHESLTTHKNGTNRLHSYLHSSRSETVVHNLSVHVPDESHLDTAKEPRLSAVDDGPKPSSEDHRSPICSLCGVSGPLSITPPQRRLGSNSFNEYTDNVINLMVGQTTVPKHLWTKNRPPPPTLNSHESWSIPD